MRSLLWLTLTLCLTATAMGGDSPALRLLWNASLDLKCMSLQAANVQSSPDGTYLLTLGVTTSPSAFSLVALKAKTGQTAFSWVIPNVNCSTKSVDLHVGPTIATVSSGFGIHAYHYSSGRHVWWAPVNASAISGAIEYDNFVIFREGALLVWLDKSNGERMMKLPTGAGTDTPLVVTPQGQIFVSGGSTVVAFQMMPMSVKQIWTCSRLLLRMP